MIVKSSQVKSILFFMLSMLSITTTYSSTPKCTSSSECEGGYSAGSCPNYVCDDGGEYACKQEINASGESVCQMNANPTTLGSGGCTCS